MLLVFDVGNTRTAVGLRDGDAWVRDWRISTRGGGQADELAVLLDGLLAGCGVAPARVTAVAVASVVPAMEEVLRTLARERFGCEAFVLDHANAGLRIAVDTPEEVGADRLANVAAVRFGYRSAAIVVDAGTALTFDVASEAGEYLGGAIAPGLGVSAEALVRRTARLPRVELSPPENVVGRNTVAAMRSGLVLGWTGMVREMVRLMRRELGPGYLVVATGGLASEVAEWTGVVDVVDPLLTLDGIRILRDRHHRRRSESPGAGGTETSSEP